jgi:hypothetical protein
VGSFSSTGGNRNLRLSSDVISRLCVERKTLSIASMAWRVRRIPSELLNRDFLGFAARFMFALQLWAALSRAGRYPEEIAVFLTHLRAVRFAENNFHSFDQSL